MSVSSTRQDKVRFSSQRKQAAVPRLLRGEDLDTLSRELGSRELGVTAARLASGAMRF